jgi:hypothetical protein
MRHYSFTGKVWRYAGKAAWYFVTLPEELADEIKALKSLHIGYSGGFGSIKFNLFFLIHFVNIDSQFFHH